MPRVLTGLVAILCTVALALTSAPAAHTQQAAAKPEHVVKRLKAAEVNNSGKFFVTGKAVTYKGKKIKLQRAGSKKGNYRTIETQRTDRRTGKFRMTFKGPIGTWYRLMIPKTKKYKNTTIIIGRIIRQPDERLVR